MKNKKELLEYMEGENEWTIKYVIVEMLIDIRDVLIKIERR